MEKFSSNLYKRILWEKPLLISRVNYESRFRPHAKFQLKHSSNFENETIVPEIDKVVYSPILP